MSGKNVIAVVTGFLAHHVVDLQAMDAALSGVLHALPVNAETRETIQNAIDRVRDSAINIENAVAQFGGALSGGGDMPGPVTIKRSDIDAAVADVLPGAIAAYMAEHSAAEPANGGEVKPPVTEPANGETGSGEPGASSFGGDKMEAQ